MTINNMRIWDQVCKTDPAHTKKVTFGRKFTAIDAIYQIESATKVWGPIGEGWGFEAKHSTEHVGQISLAISDVTMWWRGDDKVNVSGTVRASSTLLSAKGHVDEDAWKKATTDALTKLLSYHGFNADVFMGQFDDNRYVQQRVREEASKKNDAPTAQESKPKLSGDLLITPNQRTRLYTRIGKLGVSEDAVKGYCMKTWGSEHFTDLTRTQYDVLDRYLDRIEAKKAEEDQPPLNPSIAQQMP